MECLFKTKLQNNIIIIYSRMVLKNFSIFQIAESLNRRFRTIENLYDQKILEYLINMIFSESSTSIIFEWQKIQNY